MKKVDFLAGHLKELIEVGAEVKKALADGKIRFVEAINIAIQARDLTALVKDAKEIREAILTMSEPEAQELAKQLNGQLKELDLVQEAGADFIQKTILVWMSVDEWVAALEEVTRKA